MLLIENPLNASPLVFPILEVFHIAGFALSIGTIAIVDFRLLGFGMRHETAAELVSDLHLWTLSGIILMLFTGLLMFSSDPDMYYLNTAFNIKMTLLVLGIVFNYTIHRKAILAGAPPGKNKVIALVSLALWVGVVFCGIFIAFIGDGIPRE
jgi:hypothetical protein